MRRHRRSAAARPAPRPRRAVRALGQAAGAGFRTPVGQAQVVGEQVVVDLAVVRDVGGGGRAAGPPPRTSSRRSKGRLKRADARQAPSTAHTRSANAQDSLPSRESWMRKPEPIACTRSAGEISGERFGVERREGEHVEGMERAPAAPTRGGCRKRPVRCGEQLPERTSKRSFEHAYTPVARQCRAGDHQNESGCTTQGIRILHIIRASRGLLP